MFYTHVPTCLPASVTSYEARGSPGIPAVVESKGAESEFAVRYRIRTENFRSRIWAALVI